MSATVFVDFDVSRDYVRLRGPLLSRLQQDGSEISDEAWDEAWTAVCLKIWRRQQVAEIDFGRAPLNYLLAAAESELRRDEGPAVRRGPHLRRERRPTLRRVLQPRRRMWPR